MDLKTKAYYILSEMEKLFPNFGSELTNWDTPFQFLIMVILSAQTTDLQVNKVVMALFERFPDPQSLIGVESLEIEKHIRSINYFRTKAKYIARSAEIICNRFNGNVPMTVEELLELPGVGKKVASVYLNDLYKSNEGIGVDTHIIRLSQRYGLSKYNHPDKIAKDLGNIYEKDDWYKVNSLFVLYGRYYCKAKVRKGESKCVFKFCEACWES